MPKEYPVALLSLKDLRAESAFLLNRQKTLKGMSKRKDWISLENPIELI